MLGRAGSTSHAALRCVLIFCSLLCAELRSALLCSVVVLCAVLRSAVRSVLCSCSVHCVVLCCCALVLPVAAARCRAQAAVVQRQCRWLPLALLPSALLFRPPDLVSSVSSLFREQSAEQWPVASGQ